MIMGNSKKILKPKRLEKGSKIGILTISSPLTKKHIDIIKGGCERLRRMGFEIIFGNTIREHDAWGGENGSQILPLINFNEIKKNPKIIMGHSDPTVILNPIFDKTGLITFYGHFASSFNPGWRWFSDYDEKTFHEILMNPKTDYVLPPSEKRETYRKGICRGRLVGGCITDLIKLLGTPYSIDFNSKILFLESYIIKPQELLAHLTHLKQAGVFEKIEGLLLGNFLIDGPKYDINLKKLFLDELSEFSFPILKTKDFGHNSHMAPLPIGGLIKLDAGKKEIVLEEKNTY